MIPLILLHIVLAAQLWPCNTDNVCYDRNGHLVTEHIIEIRTKRDHVRAKIQKAGTGPYPHSKVDYVYCPDDYYGKPQEWPNSADLTCERVTKTLYIDGQRIGVIKETEER